MGWLERLIAKAVSQPETPPGNDDDTAEFPIPEPEVDRCECGEPVMAEKTVLTIKGHEVGLSSPRFCKSCTTLYMEAYSGTCGCCGYPIMPGRNFCLSGDPDAENRYNCLSMACNESAAGYCHSTCWGEGGPANTHPLTFRIPHA